MELNKAFGVVNQALRSLRLTADDRDLVNEALQSIVQALQEASSLRAEGPEGKDKQ